jgi:hypothetical protein
MQMTHTFKLVSGIEAEVSELSGKEQRILTEQVSKTQEQRNFDLLGSLLKRVGDTDLSTMKEAERNEFLKSMLSCDRKRALGTARNYSTDFDPIYDFSYEYDSEDKKKGKQIWYEKCQIGDDGDFSFTPIKHFEQSMLVNEQGKPLTKLRDIEAVLSQLEPAYFSTMEELNKAKFIYAILPKSGTQIRLRMLDGIGEAIGGATKKDQRSSHTSLIMRNACYQHKGDVYISYTLSDLDKLPLTDLEFMRLLIKYIEGRVDSEVRFEHPEADLKATGDKIVIVDLMSQISFFFQSGGI